MKLFARFLNWLKGLFRRDPFEVLKDHYKQEEFPLTRAVQAYKPPPKPEKREPGPAQYRRGSKKRIARVGWEREKQVGGGTYSRLKWIGGHPVRPQKRGDK